MANLDKKKKHYTRTLFTLIMRFFRFGGSSIVFNFPRSDRNFFGNSGSWRSPSQITTAVNVPSLSAAILCMHCCGILEMIIKLLLTVFPLISFLLGAYFSSSLFLALFLSLALSFSHTLSHAHTLLLFVCCLIVCFAVPPPDTVVHTQF